MLSILESWFELASQFVAEPTTTLTDYLMAGAALACAVAVSRSLPRDSARWRNLWVVSFSGVVLTAISGGTMHGLSSQFGATARFLMEILTLVLIVGTSGLFVAAAATSRIGPSAGRWLLGGLFITLCGVVILESDLVLFPAFSRVDLYHCVQIVALLLFCRGACSVRHNAARYRRRLVMTRLGRLQLLGRNAQ